MSERSKHNIIGFQFSCKHECHEYKWGVCEHCRSRHKCIEYSRPVYPSEEGIYYATEKIEISPKHAEDLGTYIHEFTEASIIQILLKMRKDWHREVKFGTFDKTYVVHFISFYGTNNNTCLEPATKSNRPRW